MFYRRYVTDCLKFSIDGSNQYIVKRFIDVLYPEVEDTRSGGEIAQEIINKAGLVLVGDKK